MATAQEIESGDSATVYSALLAVLGDYEVPLHKLIGVCADGAATMQGIYRGVCTRLLNHVRSLRDQAMVQIADGTIGRTLDTFHPQRGVFKVHCVCHRIRVNCN